MVFTLVLEGARHSSRSTASRAAIGCGIALAALAGCDDRKAVDQRYTEVAGGSVERGQRLLGHYQCGSCHAIPEVPGAAGVTGPALAGFGRRSYIAGEVPNAPATLTRWIESPQELVPGTAMPDLGASRDDARDMAAYLLSLR
jgi:cytochrome c